GFEYDPSNSSSFSAYLDLLKSSKMIQGFGIISIGLLAVMLRPYDTKKPINLNMLFKSMKLAHWKNFVCCVCIYFLFSILIPEGNLYDNYFYYEISLMDSYSYNTRDAWWWINAVTGLVFAILPYFLAALFVQLVDSRFTLIPKNRGANVLSGMILLMVVVMSI